MKSVINGAVDTALRTIASLEAAGATGLDMEDLRLFDIFVVFASDLGGPASLHPVTSGHLNGYTFRAGHIQASLDFLGEAGLVAEVEGRWILTPAWDIQLSHAVPCVYTKGLGTSARWIATEMERLGAPAMRRKMQSVIMQDVAGGMAMPATRFDYLAIAYGSDVDRLEAITGLAGELSRNHGTNTHDLAMQALAEMRSTMRNLSGLGTVIAERKAAEDAVFDVFVQVSELPPAKARPLFDALRDRHVREDRHYHDWDRVGRLIHALSALEGVSEKTRREVALAVFYMDAVCDPLGRNNERMSASLMAADMVKLGINCLVRVSAMIAASDHRSEPRDEATALLLDLDHSDLAAGELSYDEYSDGIRRECSHVSDTEWAAGRHAVLSGMLMGKIYRTRWFAEFETRARKNIVDEMAMLRKRAG